MRRVALMKSVVWDSAVVVTGPGRPYISIEYYPKAWNAWHFRGRVGAISNPLSTLSSQIFGRNSVEDERRV